MFLLALTCHLNGQSSEQYIRSTLLKNTFDSYSFTPAPKRKLLDLSTKSFLSRINPANYLAAGILFVYQRIFSEQIQAQCKYVVSCSEYTKLSIQHHGLIMGSLIGLDQLSCCFPTVTVDYPEYLLNTKMQVINNGLDE